MVLVKFYCDVINRSYLQLINTLIDTFFSNLGGFLVEQRRRRKYITCEKSGGLHIVEPGLQQAGRQAGRQSGRQNLGEA